MTSNLLLIGGTGFLGRHIARRAHEAGFYCTLVGRTIDPEVVRRIGPDGRLIDAVTFARPEGDEAIGSAATIVYLVSHSVPSSSAAAPSIEIDENVRPAFEAFQRISRVNPSARIVFISSGGTVYGDAGGKPIPEDAPLRPISPYGLGKVLIEQLLTFVATTNAQPTAILRVANPIGRFHRGGPQGLVPAILRSVHEGRPIPVFGDGSQVRDYLDADDVADAVLKVAGLGTTPRHDTWNVGSGVGHSVIEVIELVGAVLGKAPSIDWRPARTIDVARSVLDTTRIRHDLGWEATTPLRRSIEKVVEAG